MESHQFKYGKGYLLIANPVLPDPNFSRSVVLLCNHNDQGSFGLVVNRTADLKVAEVFSSYELLKTYEGRIYVGGPVSPSQVFYLCRSETPLPEMDHVHDGIYLGMNWDALAEVLKVLKDPEKNIRFYLGYSGWGGGQLANEMSQKSWLTCESRDSFIFAGADENLWSQVVRSLGKGYEYLLNAPVNPQWN
ncbi:MAG: YqgE/AlgH family protein [Nitrospinae bacterium]|nr:YqgE/AlgH family protein [Nitrospinota bacterium]